MTVLTLFLPRWPCAADRVSHFRRRPTSDSLSRQTDNSNSEISVVFLLDCIADRQRLVAGSAVTCLLVCQRSSLKSETRMTASVLKQDPNTWKVLKNAYLLGHKHRIYKFSGEFPFSSYKTTLKQKQTKQNKKRKQNKKSNRAQPKKKRQVISLLISLYRYRYKIYFLPF